MTQPLLAGIMLVFLFSSAPVTTWAQNIATVNGKEITKARVESVINQLKIQGQSVTPDIEKKVADEVVLREIYLQEAERRGLGNSDALKTQLELARENLVINALFNDLIKSKPVTDEEILTYYNNIKKQAASTEYRARHILLKSSDKAKQLLKQLKNGVKFDELARKNSQDAGSKAQGGDLDFANPQSFAPEFSAALVKLKKGELAPDPVKTEFGYHIIKLEDTREAAFPALEEVKARIVKNLEQQRLVQFREDLRSSAKTDHVFSDTPK